MLGLVTFVLLTVVGLGWFHYHQIDVITNAATQGRDNYTWDFFKLELELARYQTALREVSLQPENTSSMAELKDEYEIFTSQVLILEDSNGGEIMREQPSFRQALTELRAYVKSADSYFESRQKPLDPSALKALMDDARSLRLSVHKLVLDAHAFQTANSRNAFIEIRSFSFNYGIISALLMVFMTGFGLLFVRDLLRSEKVQVAQSELLRERKEIAEAANQAKSQFLAAASHDLRQPAHAIGLFVERLWQLSDEPQTRQLLSSLQASVRSLQDMLDNMFELARLNSDSFHPRLSDLQIAALFAQLRGSFAGVAVEKGLRLRFRRSDTCLYTDPILLYQILFNLISNALRYTHHGTVLVTCRHAPGSGQARLQVWDSGIGIDEQHHSNIFVEYFQVENSQRDRNKGLGLGLSTVYRSCELLHYPLTVRSASGKGSRFTIMVPSSSLQNRESPVPEQVGMAVQSLPDSSIKGRHILVIEDDQLSRLAIAELMQSWDYRVTVADGAQNARELYDSANPVDIIVSDFRLGGGINGIETIRLLRDLAGRKIAACLVSGDTSVNIRQQAQAADLVLLQKPVRPAKLRSLLARLK